MGVSKLGSPKIQARRRSGEGADEATEVPPVMRISAARRPFALFAVMVAVPVSLAACSSSGAGGGAAQSKAPAALCQKLNAVFSDGPDPDSDPVGYALSQIRPLSAIHTSDQTAASTLTKLLSADRALVKASGSDASAKSSIDHAFSTLNTACPGVAP